MEKGHDVTIKIKIASNLYDLNEEPLVIKVPNLVLEPKEKGGEVTLQQDGVPCIVVDVGAGNQVTINNTRMLLKGQEKRRLVKTSMDQEAIQRGGKPISPTGEESAAARKSGANKRAKANQRENSPTRIGGLLP